MKEEVKALGRDWARKNLIERAQETDGHSWYQRDQVSAFRCQLAFCGPRGSASRQTYRDIMGQMRDKVLPVQAPGL